MKKMVLIASFSLLLAACGEDDSKKQNVLGTAEGEVEGVDSNSGDVEKVEKKQLALKEGPIYLEESFSDIYDESEDAFLNRLRNNVEHFEKYGKDYYVSIGKYVKDNKNNKDKSENQENQDTIPVYVTVVENGKIIEKDVFTKLTFFGENTKYNPLKPTIEIGSNKDYLLVTAIEQKDNIETPYIRYYDIKENGTLEVLKESKQPDVIGSIMNTIEGDVFVTAEKDPKGINKILDEEFKVVYEYDPTNPYIDSNQYLADLRKGYLFIAYNQASDLNHIYDLNKQEVIWNDDGKEKEFKTNFDSNIESFRYAAVKDGFYVACKSNNDDLVSVSYYNYDGEDIELVSSLELKDLLKSVSAEKAPFELTVQDKEVILTRYVVFKGKPTVEKYVFDRIDKK
ncbi:hypothetical protein ACQKNB_20225 [Lysinibacillus xylanilyticus]|uniref:hypothetical protein n=1 Tax=Lysinibacillus xylanilyticus TaxID=582475 RepID=UPI003D064C19